MATKHRPALRAAAAGHPAIGDTIDVEIASLQVPFYVRRKLDDGWTLQLAELMENGTTLPPIKVIGANRLGWQVRDGRHRIEAHRLLDRKHIKAVVVAPAKDEVGEISAAYNDNAGGALPPSKEDMAHTITLLLGHGLKPHAIAALIPTFPQSLVRKYVDTIHNREKQARLREAVGAVADGELNAPQAAEKYGVDLDQLRRAIGGKKKASVARAAEVVRGLQQRALSYSQTNAQLMKKQVEGFLDGDITGHQLDVVVKRLIDATKRTWVSAQGWQARIEDAKKQRARLANVREDD